MNHPRIFTRLSKLTWKVGVRVAYKQDLAWMRLLAKTPFVRRGFLERVSNWGTTVYFPNPTWCQQHPEQAWRALANRIAVAAIAKRQTYPVFLFLYNFPQNLAWGASLALVEGPYWLLLLLAALPWPAPFRKKAEMQACAMDLAVAFWSEQPVQPDPRMADLFTGRAFYFMWPFRQRVQQELLKCAAMPCPSRPLGRLPYASEIRFAIRIESALR